MRINKYVAQSSPLSRRAADTAIAEARITINGVIAQTGDTVQARDIVALDNQPITPAAKHTTIMLNKPYNYVCSRDGQGSKTIYELLPAEYQHLQPVGRLDKDSSGLLLLTDDGELANQLTHPRYGKVKVYEVRLNQPLKPLHQQMITDYGLTLEDGNSSFQIEPLEGHSHLRITMSEGRNRQIRRTFSALDYTVKRLHRIQFGRYSLGDLAAGSITLLR